jgi:squalene-hopene/tetraprenyl-beta-curcumene cyclase
MNRSARLAGKAIALGMAFTLSVAHSRGGDEAKAPAWKPQRVASYLDQRTEWWLTWPRAARGQGTACLSCHGTVPYALARPALSARMGEADVAAAQQKLIDSVKKRVENWNQIVSASPPKDACVPFYAGDRKPLSLGTEAVLNALLLTRHAAGRTNGVLDLETQHALAHLWEQQQPTGAWPWFEFGLNPWETGCEYYGAGLAALALGTAGATYYEQPGIKEKVNSLRKYLRTQANTQPLHHRLVAVWASSRLPDLLTENQKGSIIAELTRLQEADGGWSLPRLGKQGGDQWHSHGVFPEGTLSDGYATGLAVLALKSARVRPDDKVLRTGLLWLETHEKDGTWPIHYPNKTRDPQTDIGKFMRDAATAYAVLALTETVKEPVDKSAPSKN